MVPHTWQSPSSPPPQSPLTSQQPPISLLFTNLLFKTQSSPLSEESIFFHLIPLPSHFRFSRGFPHNSSTHSVKFQFQVESDPVTEQSPSSPRHLASHIPADARDTLKQKTKWCQLEMMLFSVFVFLEDLNQFFSSFFCE